MDLFLFVCIKIKGVFDVVFKVLMLGIDVVCDSDEELEDDSDVDFDIEEDERRLDKEVDDMWDMYKVC